MNARITHFSEKRWLGWGLRLMLSCVFIYAGASKVVLPESFANSIATFRLLPEPLIGPLALGLPLFELAVGGMLLSKRWLRLAALGAVVMTAVVIVALGSALVRGINVDCGCFGGGHIDAATSSYADLGRDLLLGMGATVLYWRASGVGRGSTAKPENAYLAHKISLS